MFSKRMQSFYKGPCVFSDRLHHTYVCAFWSGLSGQQPRYSTIKNKIQEINAQKPMLRQRWFPLAMSPALCRPSDPPLYKRACRCVFIHNPMRVSLWRPAQEPSERVSTLTPNIYIGKFPFWEPEIPQVLMQVLWSPLNLAWGRCCTYPSQTTPHNVVTRGSKGKFREQWTVFLTKQGAEELTLEDIDDSVQRLLQLWVLLCVALCAPALVLVLVLVLLPLVKFGPILLQELQGSLSVWTQNILVRNDDYLGILE